MAYFVSKDSRSHAPRALSVSPGRAAYERALSGTYLERDCVHACTQLYTRRYTVVYTRVYFTFLGSRYTLGKITPRRQMLLSLYDATIFVYKPSLRTRGTSPAITDCMLGD